MRLLLAVILCAALALLIVFWPAAPPEQTPPITPSPPAQTVTEPLQKPSPEPAAAPEPEVAPAKTFAPFIEPMTPAVYELASGALATWRQHAKHKPTLVLFSKHPFLTPLPEESLDEIRQFVRSAPAAEVVRRGYTQVADPMIASPQTVSAAIDAGLISELVFVFVEPTTRKTTDVALADFQQRAFAAEFLTGEEARALTVKDGIITGTLRGIPFRCLRLEKLPKIDGPVIVHVDLGFLEELYVNAIKTPVYPLIYKLIDAIRTANWPVLAVTLSFSNLEVEFPLEHRFMITTLADTLYHPALIGGGVPDSWLLRANAQYAAEMFAEGMSQDLVAEATRISPDDPAAFYDYSLVLFRQKNNREAFAALEQAVKLDRGYALAYLYLTETGMDMGVPGRSLELLTKAAAAFPDNPFIRISRADMLIRLGRGAEALPQLRELKQLPWSVEYHPGVPALLDEMIEAAGE